MEPAFIVAEIGMNHMGDQFYADHYLEALGAVRPDGLTFQVRENAYYEKQKAGESTLLSDEYYGFASDWTKDHGVRFGVALCDVERLPFFESIGTDFYKVIRGDINNRELVGALLGTGKPVYISTGMSDEDGIWKALIGLLHTPSNLSLIHTQLSYDDADTNLRAIKGLRERFGVPVAFGSHSTDVNALYASLGFSPSALFFYVKGGRRIKHKDERHAVSLEQCGAVIAEIRRLELMMGDGIKKKMANTINP